MLDQSEVRSPFYYSILYGLRSAVIEAASSPTTLYVVSLDLPCLIGPFCEPSVKSHLGKGSLSAEGRPGGAVSHLRLPLVRG